MKKQLKKSDFCVHVKNVARIKMVGALERRPEGESFHWTDID